MTKRYGIKLYIHEDDLPLDAKQEITRADDEGYPYHIKFANFKLSGEHAGEHYTRLS